MREGTLARTFARRAPDLREVPVLVVGLAKSGLAAARLLLGRGARVTIADRRPAAELEPRGSEAVALGARLVDGGHPAGLVDDCELVVVSPGVPLADPLFDRARELGVPVWGEVELASRFCRGRIVGVTGSNGKSTVTSMIGAVLRGAGVPGGTGGNLDTPLAELLSLDSDDAVHAVELSSFQLESIDAFRADVAVVVNVSPDHLDRYASYEEYARAKARLLESQDARGFAVLNADDPESARFGSYVRGRLHRFSLRGEVERGAFLRAGMLTLRTEAGEETTLRADALRVPGDHNVANALAAALACRLVGCSTQVIAEGLAGYRALPHRLEHVARVGGVDFYDDSKATNVDSAARAVESFPGRGLQVILGGKDKGADWLSLRPLLAGRVRRVLLVGQAAPAIRRALEGAVELLDCETVPAAARTGLAGARPGEVVLLSPACASFDQYRNFEERGNDFRRAVEALARERSS